MAKQTINVGSTANDGTGDKLRDAFVKVNANFTELYSDDAGDVNSVNAGTGISVNQTTGAVTVTNSAPDQTVTLTEGQNVTITGTYPNFTIASNDVVGAVTSVNAGTGVSVDQTTGVVTVTNSGTLDIITDNGATTTNSLTVGGLHINSTDAVEMPTGTDGERPTPVAGMFRFNTTSNEFEGYDGTAWGAIGGTGSTINIDNFNGNGSTTVFTLSQSLDNENVSQVYIDGVYQQKNTYSVVGTAITFSEAPPTGTNNIEVVSITTVAIDTIADDIVTYAKLGTEFTSTGILGGTVIDFAAAQVFTKTLTADTTFTFSNAQVGMVKDLIITGSFAPTFPAGTKVVAGTYNGAVSNLIQVIVAAPADYWLSISQAI